MDKVYSKVNEALTTVGVDYKVDSFTELLIAGVAGPVALFLVAAFVFEFLMSD